MTTTGLLDTWVFIARETARPLGDLPDLVAVSVVSLGELELGVLAAGHTKSSSGHPAIGQTH